MIALNKLSDLPEKLERTTLLIGKDRLERLFKAKVTVLGLGAVGGYAVEAMARAGVGSLRLVDFDIIRTSNMNRHIWATDETIGQPKSAVAKERLKLINPGIQVEALECFASEDTFEHIFGNNPDIVIDAIDSLNPKVQTLAYCFHHKLSIVSSMGAATRTDPFKIRIADIFDTKVCPLAARIRRRLKDLNVGKGITCVYSEQHQDVHALSMEIPRNPLDFQRGRSRRTLGSLSTITGIFGLIVAHAAMEKICGGWESN